MQLLTPTEFQLGWIVGLIDGEGTFTIRRRQAAIRVVLVESDLCNLNKRTQYLGVGYINGPYGPYQPNHKPYYTWSIGDYKNVYRVCMLIQPHMSPRRQKQIQDVLNFIILTDRKKSYDV